MRRVVKRWVMVVVGPFEHRPNLETSLTRYGKHIASLQIAMADSENPTPIADPEEFEKESKRVMNKLRSDLDNLIVAEDTGIPLLRYGLRSELRHDWARRNVIQDLVRITEDAKA